jgi:hypothetical protein
VKSDQRISALEGSGKPDLPGVFAAAGVLTEEGGFFAVQHLRS